MKSTLEMALHLYEIGISPVAARGKVPFMKGWQDKKWTVDEIKRAFSNGCNVGVVCGGKSGNLVIDHDCGGEAYNEYVSRVERLASGLINRLVIEQTPSGGYHLHFRVHDIPISGNQKLASKRITVSGPGDHPYRGKDYKALQDGDNWVICPDLIETRGEGGQAIIWPSPGYQLIQPGEDGIFNPPPISAKEHKVLIDTAKTFHEPLKKDAFVPPSINCGSCRPGDDFNNRATGETVLSLLSEVGYQIHSRSGDKTYVTRPGKDPKEGPSGTVFDSGVFYPHSTNTADFEAFKSYSPFAVYALMEHKGDFRQAARELSMQGYGERNESQISVGEKKPTKAIVLGIADFLAHKFPLRKNLLSPWLPVQGLAMIFAYRGIGKTYLALFISYSIATAGRFLNWLAPEPAGVLYLDGEMPGPVLQERLARIVESSEREPLAPFNILTPDLQPRGMPKIDTKEGQDAVEALLTPDIKLIVVDNISTLTSAKENEADSWTPVQAWALQQRAKGRTVLFIHHAGKSGAQRGTSRREDVLDTVISLRRPVGYSAAQGAVFEIHFEKSRGIYGADVKPVEATLATDEKGRMAWAIRSVEDSTYDRVVMLMKEGLSQKEVSSELGVNKSTVSRHVKRAKEAGQICYPMSVK